MKKTLLIALLLAIMALSHIGCSTTQQPAEVSIPEESTKKLNIIATTFPQYDFTRQIVGDKANVTLLLSPGLETHSFEPSPKDQVDISNSDMFIYTGGEKWVDHIVDTGSTDGVRLINLMDSVSVVEEQITEGMEHEHEHEEHEHEEHEHEEHEHEEHEHEEHEHEEHEHEEHEHEEHEHEEHEHEEHEHEEHEHEEHEHEEHEHEEHEHEEHEHEEHEHEGDDHEEGDHEDHTNQIAYDEHVWTSPQNAIAIVKHIRDELILLDTDSASYYKANAEAYIQELQSLDQIFVDATSNSKRETIIVADRFPFRYLTDAYGLTYYAAFAGCSTQTDPSPATLTFLIDKMNEEEIPVVFYTEQSNQQMADLICESSTSKKLLLHSCHNITAEEIKAGTDYISLMTQNAKHLKEALN